MAKELMTDEALDNIVGGATKVLYYDDTAHDGACRVMTASFNGDVAGLQKLLQGGALKSLEVSGNIGHVTLPPKNLEKYLDRKQGQGFTCVKISFTDDVWKQYGGQL